MEAYVARGVLFGTQQRFKEVHFMFFGFNYHLNSFFVVCYCINCQAASDFRSALRLDTEDKVYERVSLEALNRILHE
jgi:hypothetical protein